MDKTIEEKEVFELNKLDLDNLSREELYEVIFTLQAMYMLVAGKQKGC